MRTWILAVAIAVTTAGTGHAASPLVCAPDAPPDKFRMLRQLNK